MKELIQCLDLFLVYQFPLYPFFLSLLFLIFCIYRRAPSPACVTSSLLLLWPHFFILDTALPFFFMNSQVIYLCSVSVCLARTDLFCAARKWTQLRMEHGSGQLFDQTALCCCSYSTKQAWKSASQWGAAGPLGFRVDLNLYLL